MAYQQYIQKNALKTILLRDEAIHKALLIEKISALRRGIFIPDSLIAEIEQFTSRNMLSNAGLIESKHLTSEPKEACPHCIKAHALKHAAKLDLPIETLEFLNEFIPGENGHNGYYLDENKLVKIEED